MNPFLTPPPPNGTIVKIVSFSLLGQGPVENSEAMINK